MLRAATARARRHRAAALRAAYPASKRVLRCEECARGPDGAEGWRAFWFERLEDGSDGVALFCPACAAREFGPIEPAQARPAIRTTRLARRIALIRPGG